ncbi:histidine-type phosphatase [Caulobacter sp. RL271]|uniref:Histidine-type phosphatase n=1 Tax=Caulobacter segnis TaxID=88688 RepID=A0ABY4ZXY9_9CAUL|nr:histidine-type phosphatase [Caulobacter segnis]USQ97209.1 histidine-type phosphatase [Caulobacter segnis]
MPGLRPRHLLAQVLLACAMMACATASLAASPRVERVVIIMRHGVRAPIVGEAPLDTLTGAPWPTWSVPPEHLTAHGAKALDILGRSDRRWLAGLGVLPALGCPAEGQVRIWTNTAERTIASGEAFARGLTPGCETPVGHRPPNEVDPLFEPLRAGVAPFDPAAAIASIQAYTGGVDHLAARLQPALDELDRVLDCGAGKACSPRRASSVAPSADGRGIDLTGPIRDASGTAQVLLLQYVEGLSPAAASWRGVEPDTLKRLGALHAALFDVFTRPPYMTARQAGPLSRRVLEALDAPSVGGVDIFMGHDTNVTAMAAALGARLDAPGYATGDVPPGGALIFMSLVDDAGSRSVRVYYQTQSPQALRGLNDRVSRPAIGVLGHDSRAIPSGEFRRRLEAAITTNTDSPD